jgi:hypothetical protein
MGNVIKLRGFGPKPPTNSIKLYRADGTEVHVGDKVTTRDGEVATVTGWPSNGHNRVWVEWATGLHLTKELFPSVFDLHLAAGRP